MLLSPKSPRYKRRQRILSAGSLFIILILVYWYRSDQSDFRVPLSITGIQYEVVHESSRSADPLLNHHAHFWQHLHQLIVKHDPKCSKLPEAVVPMGLDVAFDSKEALVRPDLLWIGDSDLERLKSSHAAFVQDLRTTSLGLVYVAGTRGIVTTVSDKLLPVLLISLRMIRATKTILPVEIFLLKPSTYSDAFCNGVFRSLHAKCSYFSNVFNTASTQVSFNSYQYKVLSVLFSSFEEVLLLDSDAWPITDPDFLFTSPSFLRTGMTLWPDFWFPSESVYFFQVAGIEDVPQRNARAATESGQVLYSKPKHELSIMLATYYNYYGPDYYYLLQSQGAPGQGDKETFPWAAAAVGEEFHFVHTPVTALGRNDSKEGFIGSVMVQYSPWTDQPDAAPKSELQRPLFIHANFPKFDPYTIFTSKTGGGATPVQDSNQSAVRCWDLDVSTYTSLFGFDLEKRLWQIIRNVTCQDLMGLELFDGLTHALTDPVERERILARDRDLCETVERYYGEVFEGLKKAR